MRPSIGVSEVRQQHPLAMFVGMAVNIMGRDFAVLGLAHHDGQSSTCMVSEASPGTGESGETGGSTKSSGDVAGGCWSLGASRGIGSAAGTCACGDAGWSMGMGSSEERAC